ncbi:hypothetical protein [Vibrio harveyi]|uniref:hypothetical protein n=1 Tax=Vibrio harveyi TaxID=669 RepID=UPI00111BF75E|nr:hypothetical protein [Vibrio harveyi]
MNLLWGVISIFAALTVDKSKFPIHCELDKLSTVIDGGYSSLGYVASETAMALRAAELGVPDFFSTPAIPAFFGVVWLIKFAFLENKSSDLYVINGILALLTFFALFIGFSTKMSTWWDTESIKRKLGNNHSILSSYSYTVDEIVDSSDIISNKSTCYIAIEVHILATDSVCDEENLAECYVDYVSDKANYETLERKGQQWLHEAK